MYLESCEKQVMLSLEKKKNVRGTIWSIHTNRVRVSDVIIHDVLNGLLNRFSEGSKSGSGKLVEDD